jgi:hypothetical protein
MGGGNMSHKESYQEEIFEIWDSYDLVVEERDEARRLAEKWRDDSLARSKTDYYCHPREDLDETLPWEVEK